ncbi:MAG: hypothetical protein ACYCTE_12690 [Acidimicrobiales bacterium]
MVEFRFDRNYENSEQVRHLMPAYLRRYESLRADGEYPYNDSFKGHLGLTADSDEDTAIYLCQTLRRLDEDRALIVAALAEGFQPIEYDAVAGPIRGSVIEHSFYVGGTGFRRWDDVRRVRSGRNGLAVLAKGARTRGHILSGHGVLVKAAVAARS